jgi:hypothetical protein
MLFQKNNSNGRSSIREHDCSKHIGLNCRCKLCGKTVHQWKLYYNVRPSWSKGEEGMYSMYDGVDQCRCKRCSLVKAEAPHD